MASPTKSPTGRPVVTAGAAPGVVLWAARALWLVVAVLGGAGFGEAFADHSRAVQLTGTSLLWFGWAAVAVVLAIPSAVGLTLARIVAPMGVAAAAAASVDVGVTAGTAVALSSTVLAAVVVGSGEFGQTMVQASAYGDEQRFLLRPPAAFYVPTLVSWTLLCASATTGPLLLAAGNLLGIVVVAVAVLLAVFLPSRFHRLARRWVVLVPAGFVLHDHVVLAETVMFRQQTLTRTRLALADTQAADFTGPAGGHAVEVTVNESTTVVLAGTRAKPNGTALHVLAFLVAPTRPGRLLAAAEARRLPVG